MPSLNIDIPSGSGFVVELRLGRAGGAFWTRFYYLGTWGSAPRPEQRLLQDENGRLDQDYFFSGNRFDRLQYRVHLFASDASKAPVIRRFALAYSNTLNDADLARRFRKPVDPGPRQRWARRLDVPFRSQKWEHPRVRGSICSPTSVSMVLEFLGIYLPTSRVYETIWDPEYRLYGNWMRAVESAYLLGAPGYIERFGDWNAVRRHIARGEPVIASIRAERGQIRNSPYRESNGHLLVVAGFDGQESVHINDPAGRNPAEGMIRYHLEDMEKVWFGHGGVGYVLLRPGTVAVSTAR